MSEHDPYQQQPNQQQSNQQQSPSYGQQQPQHGQQPPQGQPQYVQQPYYGQPQYGQPGFPQGGYGAPLLPKHPQSTTALVLGLVGLAGGFMCFLPLLCAPFAWFYGRKAVREIDAAPQSYSGRSEAIGGMVTGIIGTVILFLGLLVLAAGLIFLLTIGTTTEIVTDSTGVPT